MTPEIPASPAGMPGGALVAPADGPPAGPPLPGAGVEAALEGLERDGLAVVPGFLDGEAAGRLRDAARSIHARGGFRAAGVGRGPSFRVRPDVRCDEVCWLDGAVHGTEVGAWLARMEALRMAINARLFLGLFGYEGHFSLYPPGAFYRIHLDRFRDAPLRTLSSVLYLNQGWRPADGGALRIYEEAAARPPWRDVAPDAGTLVLFLSDRFPHEVLPARRHRWSLTGWFTRRP